MNAPDMFGTEAAYVAKIQLGMLLLGKGAVSRGQILECLGLQRQLCSGPPLGSLLLHRGFITIETLRAALREQEPAQAQGLTMDS